MRWRLKNYLRRLRTATRPMRERGWGIALFWHVPAAFFLRGWRALAQPVNGGWIQRAFNRPRFVAFERSLPPSPLPRFYVIVMPLTLHFLLPCLALLAGRAQVVLLINGARRWERALLAERVAALPQFVLRTLPLSSVAHGNVISLLLENEHADFGLIDHDCYVFDEAVFAQLKPAEDECVLALFSEQSRSVGVTFPLTFFLYFNCKALQRIMRRHGIDARLYREVPPMAREPLAKVGLGPNTFWKHYHNFRDTLHVLLAVATAESMKFRFLNPDDARPATHVGGTSIGSHHAKSLFALYIHLRFLEHLNDPLISRRYAHLTAPLKSAQEVLARSDRSGPEWQGLSVVEAILQRLGRRDGAATDVGEWDGIRGAGSKSV